MGFLDFFTNLFARSGKAKSRAKKKSAKKTQAPKSAPAAKGGKKGSGDEFGVSLAKAKEKKRKKSTQVSAAPIDEKALGFSISLKGEDAQSKKREALRIRVDNLFVHVSRLNKKYPVTDISATGLGFAFEKPRVKGGVELVMTIIVDGKVAAKDVQCKVMRHERGSVGCVFVDLDRAQDDAVHAIVLRGQKEQAARKAAQKNRDFKIPE
ncbi:MAG: PilZ domain-containing protein [Pseudodesulfovibrio sp.]|uniref:Type IV pilus assembly PilZ n=1 Tax=Pseudodesulfovibrio aespoeensis (strain ATCC 700646 / DSM 10631 / Aspo-2) TaxID=643562 RepID=E6VQW1_PSEA9|nr:MULTISPECIES: PilZ domain-containing protein [Pseudodesulfovibrio]MBU4243755.1 PilZ domain-containing protein [Pseudomonadota bacterium]ADU62941.1 type IV pilus assembly PilZ [Pseudodesulfovibrio aespoeensis Aspo-2]MBU4378356.1 PilZ domain-containing protein [Pseudomonadota bacterium]MBU4473751.1 PilZ domain-containing protein [Pseudomonadota bacterium]MBU4514663.1 PilZ domain-containing protein [Pseudomonadota bacterium]